MRSLTLKLITTGLVCVLLLPDLSVPVYAGRSHIGSPAQEKARGGVHTTTFDLPQGKVRVYLPDDIRAGDTISGTVHEATDDNSKSSSFVLEVEGNKPTPISEKIFKFVVPAAAGSLAMTIKNSDGTEVGRAAIPIQPTSSAPPSNFVLPRIGQAGRRIEIPGPFDGDLGTTHVDVGPRRAGIIAESPRKLVIEIPPEPNGPVTITVIEQGKATTGEFRNIGVNLSAPKTNLAKGEKTTLTVQVTGLQGIKQNLPLDLVTTGVVEVQGGNTQQITIKPNEVRPDGSTTLTRTLTGVRAGTFNVTATVVVPPPT